MRRLSMEPELVRATLREHTRTLPGDGLIPDAMATLTHAITIRRPREAVWPWLAQMGAGTRAGWYSYDVIDNGRQTSANRIRPDLQDIAVGAVFPARPGETAGFLVLAFEVPRHLVLGWTAADGAPIVTWSFVLDAIDGETTRLITRARANHAYPFYGLPPALGRPLIRLAHFVMTRKQLLGIARRAESMPPAAAAAGGEEAA